MIRFFLLLAAAAGALVAGQEGLIPAFALEPNPMELRRLAQPGTPFDKVGRRFALLGAESGSFEAWAYPLKLLRNFEFSFFIGSSTRPIRAGEIVRDIAVTPEATVLTWSFQSFTVRAVFITPQHEPGALILLDVDSDEPLQIVCGFLPVLQPMWPAGIGGQYAYWDDKIKAYIISESSRRNHGIVGSPAAAGMSYTPAHMLADAPSEFKIDIADPAKVRGKYIPIALAGGKGKREDVTVAYQRLLADPEKHYRENLRHFRELQERTLRIETPEREIDLAFAWAKVAFDGLMVDNPDLGSGMVAGLGMSGTSGRPGFGWFFGGDTFINSFSLDGYGALEDVRRILAFTQKWQRPDGKMAHELSQAAAYIDWFKDYPYAYIHADTTPFYIVAMRDYFQRSGDIAFLRQSWSSLRRAFDWCLATDANGDGLMDNRKAGLGGVEYGALTDIETDIYLASVWAEAARAMKELAEAAGDGKSALRAAAAAAKAAESFDERFWDGEKGFFVFGFNSRGEKVGEVTPTAAVGLMWGLGAAGGRNKRALERLCRADMMTDWGVRSVSAESRFYEPLNYNYGAVWPFNNGWVAAALFRAGMSQQGYGLLLATARQTFANNLGAITEVFSGARNVWPQEAVSHQGFSSAGVVLPLVRGLLGLDIDAARKRIRFAPQFPAGWERARIANCRIGEAEFSIAYRRGRARLEFDVQCSDAGGFIVEIGIPSNQGFRVNAARINDSPALARDAGHAAAEGRERGLFTWFESRLDGAKSHTVRFVFEIDPMLQVLPPENDNHGGRDRGLKLVALEREASRLVLKVQGLAGAAYELGLVNADLAASVSGAELRGGKLLIAFPAGKADEFVERTVVVETR